MADCQLQTYEVQVGSDGSMWQHPALASTNPHAVKDIRPKLADFLADDGTEQAVIKDKIEELVTPKQKQRLRLQMPTFGRKIGFTTTLLIMPSKDLALPSLILAMQLMSSTAI